MSTIQNTTTNTTTKTPLLGAGAAAAMNIVIEFEVKRMNRNAIGYLVSPGLKDIHKKVGGRIYLHWNEEEGDAKGASGFVTVASTDRARIDEALKELAELVVRCQRIQGRPPVRQIPTQATQRYRMSARGNYEEIPAAPAPPRATISDTVKVAQRQRRGAIDLPRSTAMCGVCNQPIGNQQTMLAGEDPTLCDSCQELAHLGELAAQRLR